MLSYLWDLEKHIGWREILNYHMGGKPQRDGTIFMMGELTPRDNI